ncbi:RHS domain-containing protein [Sneathiella glossodoripedis]|uniref:RHS domain-containing protein n=1 Tax=Sneathiella glossodoripedis TaxID=418853 RepID=UPI0011DCAB80|nr:RHS domain-containing protein [Sneathiella glossodoripedis]
MNYVHADHLGAPQIMTDKDRSVVWDASFLPFGEEDSIAWTLYPIPSVYVTRLNIKKIGYPAGRKISCSLDQNHLGNWFPSNPLSPSLP